MFTLQPPRHIPTLPNASVELSCMSASPPTPDVSLRGNEPTLRAMCGRLQVGKENLHVAGLVGAAMCSAFECGSHDRWP